MREQPLQFWQIRYPLTVQRSALIRAAEISRRRLALAVRAVAYSAAGGRTRETEREGERQKERPGVAKFSPEISSIIPMLSAENTRTRIAGQRNKQLRGFPRRRARATPHLEKDDHDATRENASRRMHTTLARRHASSIGQ